MTGIDLEFGGRRSRRVGLQRASGWTSLDRRWGDDGAGELSKRKSKDRVQLLAQNQRLIGFA